MTGREVGLIGGVVDALRRGNATLREMRGSLDGVDVEINERRHVHCERHRTHDVIEIVEVRHTRLVRERSQQRLR